MIIDIHTHTFPDEIAARTLEKLQHMSHTRAFTDGTVDGLKASMEAAGVDRSLVLPVATNTSGAERRGSAPSAACTRTLRTGRGSWPGWPPWG